MSILRYLIVAALVLALFGAGAPAGIAAPKSPGQLSVTTQSPTNGQTVSGNTTWQVSVSGGTATRVDFAIDGVVKWSQATSPYLYGGTSGGLDTTKLANGSHTLTATANGSKPVKPGSSQVTVTVANAVPPPPSNRVYWGAWIGDHLTGAEPPWDMSAVSAFEQLAGKPISIEHFGSPFADCYSSPCSYYPFPWTPFNDIRAHGSIPFLSWGSQSLPFNVNDPNFQLSDVINGSHDTYIRAFATKARDWGHPFFLRFDWEMNGTWFPWAEQANGNQPGEFVAAWRHVHDIFTSVGATNATWVWCPYTDPGGSSDLQSLYPGSSYVDWSCLDGYNWGTGPSSATHVWRSFDYLYNTTYHRITDTIAPGKPMAIGEVASSEVGGSKAGWIHNMFTALPTSYPNVRALVWFEHYANGMDWPIETSETSRSSFASGIQSSIYAGNTFGNIATSPIAPAP